MKWIDIKTKSDWPKQDGEYFVYVRCPLGIIKTGKVFSYGAWHLDPVEEVIKWLDESNDEDMYQAYLHGIDVQKNGGTIWEDWLTKYKSKSKQ